jgi:hypothetical protein
MAGIHLIFTSWAVGTMHLWSQAVALGLAALVFASTPTGRDGWAGNWRRLVRFPIFWLGVLWLLYAVLGALNPHATYVREGNRWWMVFREPIAWLPQGVEVPFAVGGPWRTLMIHAGVILFGLAVWLAARRRRSGRVLLMTLALNGLVLAVVGIAQRTGYLGFFVAGLRPSDAGPLPAYAFATFIYKNHAGGYLMLALTAAVALAGWYHDHARARGKKSNPSGMLGLGHSLFWRRL